MKNTALRNALVTLGSFIFVVTVVGAWTAPGGAPPTNNVSAPITISVNNQEKFGGLTVASLLSTGGIRALGRVQVGSTTAACTKDLAGSLRWTGIAFEGCDGTTWSPFGGAGGGACPKLIDNSYSITINSSQLSGYNFYNAAVACGGINLLVAQKFTLTINAGVKIGNRLTINGLVSGSSVKIINKGSIIGSGGNGGAGIDPYTWSGLPGGPGGDAITSNVPLSIDNTGLIAGGGGGGGSGQNGIGGGGGAGISIGIGGKGSESYAGWDGLNGTETTGGDGCCTWGRQWITGNGGGLGQAGQSGVGAGGSSGYSVRTGGNGITWITVGDVRGPTN